MAFDGSDWKAIDEDGYAEDRPESTALDHAARNVLAYLGKSGAQCSYAERLNASSEPAKQYSGNPSTHRVWILRASPGVHGYTVELPIAGGPSDAGGTEGDVWLSVISPEIGKVVGDKQAVTNGASVTDYETYELTVSFREFRREQMIAIAVMFQSARYNEADTGITAGGNPLYAIDDTDTPYSRSQVVTTEGEDYLIEPMNDESVSLDTQIGAPTTQTTDIQAKAFDLTWIASPSCEVRENRSDFDPGDSFEIRAHDSANGAQIPPWHHKGGGQAFRASEDVLARWHTASLGLRYDDERSGDWDEVPRWIYINTTDTPKSTTFVPMNDEIKLSFSLGLMAVFDSRSYRGERQNIQTSDVDIDLEIIDASGTTVHTINGSREVDFYARHISGDYPFYLQMEVQSGRFTAGDTPKYPFREGQLFNIDGGADELGLVERYSVTEEVTGLTAGDVYQAKFTFVGQKDSAETVVIVAHPVIQQFVTQSRAT